ncbi:MAG TPA: CPBP family intramembrane glutamic endopeptidase [Acidimicrobiia bacterium]
MRATRSAWWTWQWRGWAPWRLDTAALALASAAVLVDVASAWVDTSLGTLGRIPVSPALPIAVLLAARLGAASLGCTRAAVHAWREVAAVMTVVLVGTVVTYSVDVGGPGQAVGLFVAAAGEELVYRLAVIVLVGALAARIAGREWRRVDRWGTGPGAVGLVGGALAFSALPGHVVQMQSLATAAPFASLAILLGWVVLRTGAIWPAIAAHALLNLTTITVTATEGPGALRLALAAATLCAVVVGADVAGRRTGRLRPVPSVIDLTAV